MRIRKIYPLWVAWPFIAAKINCIYADDSGSRRAHRPPSNDADADEAWTSAAAASDDVDPNNSANDAPTERIAQQAALESQLKSLLSMAERSLQRHTENTAEYEQFASQVTSLLVQNSRLEALEKELLQRTLKVDDMIRQVNALQLQNLSSQLDQAVQQELQAAAESQAAQVDDQEQEKLDASTVVSLQELESKLGSEEMFKESGARLNQWLQEIVKEEVSLFHASRDSGSMSPLDAARLVQSALYAEKNQVDHAQGATIVHELTSPTYEPPPEREQLLGQVWWRRYIPEDWERLLPSGWETWNVGIPSSWRHTFGLPGAATLPPEAILDPNIHPGSCWPMKGRQGQVTLRLSHPVKPESVTIEHASSLLVKDRSSAPKTVRIVGYPPCTDDASKCRGMGFDVDKWKVLGMIAYDLEGTSSVQTFNVQHDEPEAGGSCTETAPSCDGTPDPLDVIGQKEKEDSDSGVGVGAITLEILDNWGNEDYTCLYRFRLHGQGSA